MIQARVEGTELVAAGLLEEMERVRKAAQKTVKKYGAMLVSRIQANASGRPGPNAPTGDYRRSWNVRFIEDAAGNFVASVGTNAPQARRLEEGFVGPDSKGRVYNQPPYPHVGPAIQVVGDKFLDEMARNVP